MENASSQVLLAQIRYHTIRCYVCTPYRTCHDSGAEGQSVLARSTDCRFNFAFCLLSAELRALALLCRYIVTITDHTCYPHP